MKFKFLSRTFPLRDYYFYVPQLCLGSMGFWPMDTCRQQAANVGAWMNLIILAIGVFTEIHAGCTVLRTDLELALDTLCPAGTSAVTLLKMTLIYYYRQDLAWVLERMRSLVYERDGEVKKFRSFRHIKYCNDQCKLRKFVLYCSMEHQRHFQICVHYLAMLFSYFINIFFLLMYNTIYLNIFVFIKKSYIIFLTFN